MKIFMLFATIYLVFLPTSLSVLVPQASVIDWTSHKNNDRRNIHLTMHSREQNETDLRRNIVDHTSSLNSKNSNDSGNNNEAFQYVRLYYLIFFNPYIVGNVSKWEKSNYDGEAVGNAHGKGINRYENVAQGVVSDENIKILNKKANYPQWYVKHVPNHKKNTTKGASNQKQYSDIAKEKSEPTDDSIFVQHYPVGNFSEWQKSNHDEEAVGNAHDKGINRYEDVAQGVVSDENIKIFNNIANYPSRYVIHVPSHKKNATNGSSNKKQYSGIARGKSGPTDDSHIKGDIGKFERKHLGADELKEKRTDVSESNKMYKKIFHFSNKQNSKLNNESEKNNEIPIFASLSVKSFNGDERNGEFNKDSKTLSKTAFSLNNVHIFDSNGTSREATGEVIQPDEKERKANFPKFFFRPYFVEYPDNMTTQNTYGLKYEVSGETGERNRLFQINDTRESHSRMKWIGEGHDEGTHTAYFIISDHADKQASFSRQKRQLKTNKESERSEQGKGRGTTTAKPSNNGSAMDGDLVKKLQNSSSIIGKVPTEDTKNKISKKNGTQRFHPNPMTSHKVNSSTRIVKSLNAFPKPYSNNPSSFHLTQSKSNPKEAVNFTVGYQKDNKRTAEGKTISESVPRSSKIGGERAVGIKDNHSILKEKFTAVKHSEIKNDGEKTRNQKGTTTKPIQRVINGSSGDTKIANKTFSNNTRDNSFRKERSLGKHPFSRIYHKADMGAKEQTKIFNETYTLATGTVKPEEISRTDNLSVAEEQKVQEVMYRSHETHVNAMLTDDETRAFNISKVDTPDKEKEIPLKQNMTEVTETVNVTTQEPVIHTGVKSNEEATHRESDSHKFDDETQTTTEKTEKLNENVTVQKPLIPLHPTDNAPVAEVENIEAVAYRNNDDHKPLETITDETQVVNRSNTGEAKEPNQATLNDNVERNSTGSHLRKEVILNLTTTEQSQTYENTTTIEIEIMTETETNSGPMDDPSYVNRQNASNTTNPGIKHETILPIQLVVTNDNDNAETKIASQGMLDNDKRNATGGNLNGTDGTNINLQRHMVPEQMQTFTDNSTFERFIFARKDVSGSTTKEPNANVTAESGINNQQEKTGLFERKKRNVEKERSEKETVRPSILDKTKDDLLKNNAVVSNNSKDATNFEIQPRITNAHSRNISGNSANKTYEANPTVSENSGNNVVTETDKFPLAHRKETAVAELSSPASVLNTTYGKTEQMAREIPVYTFNKTPLKL